MDLFASVERWSLDHEPSPVSNVGASITTRYVHVLLHQPRFILLNATQRMQDAVAREIFIDAWFVCRCRPTDSAHVRFLTMNPKRPESLVPEACSFLDYEPKACSFPDDEPKASRISPLEPVVELRLRNCPAIANKQLAVYTTSSVPMRE